jgi:hypothetical protein
MPDRPAISAPLSRRRFLGRVGRLAGGLALAPTALAACGAEARSGARPSATVSPGANGSLVVENWPNAIDTDSRGDAGGGATIQGFLAATGIGVDYRTSISDNAEWLWPRTIASWPPAWGSARTSPCSPGGWSSGS